MILKDTRQMREAAEEWRTLADRAADAGFSDHARSLSEMAEIYEHNAAAIERSKQKLGQPARWRSPLKEMRG
jgi:hypothetical protein